MKLLSAYENYSNKDLVGALASFNFLLGAFLGASFGGIDYLFEEIGQDVLFTLPPWLVFFGTLLLVCCILIAYKAKPEILKRLTDKTNNNP